MSKDGIRHYEDLGIIRSTPRLAGSRSYRDYHAGELNRVEKAHQAQQLGLSLKEIGPLLKAFDDREPSRAETVAFLNERLVTIRGKISALREVEAFLVEKVARYATTGD